MSERPSLRPAEDDDAERVRELVESSMTTSYALSPQDIDAIVEAEFAEDAFRERLDEDDTGVFVAELDGVLAGVVEATFADEDGTVRWLHVDPERRGAGVGTALFERALSAFEDRDVAERRAVTLAANNAAGAFFERFDFEQVDERETDLGGLENVEYVYADGDGSGGEQVDDGAASEGDEADYPDATTTADGERIYLGEEPFRGTEGLFVPTFADDDRSEQHGYYCANCGSTDVSMDSMERVRCDDCGNTRRPDDDYDGSYL